MNSTLGSLLTDKSWLLKSLPTTLIMSTVPGAVVMKRAQVFALGQHEELKDKSLVSEVIKRCPDPVYVVLPLEPYFSK